MLPGKQNSIIFPSLACLQPAFPIIFPTVPDCVSRLYSRLCMFPDRFPEYVPDGFPEYVPELFPTRNPFPSRRIKKSCSPLRSRRPKKVPTFPSHTHPAVTKRGRFPMPSLGKTLFLFRLRRARRSHTVPRGAFGTACTLVKQNSINRLLHTWYTTLAGNTITV